jgi:signal transduction histidine kinase
MLLQPFVENSIIPASALEHVASCASKAASGRRSVFEVEDNGEGVPEAERDA